jgi:hypothetical protein
MAPAAEIVDTSWVTTELQHSAPTIPPEDQISR